MHHFGLLQMRKVPWLTLWIFLTMGVTYGGYSVSKPPRCRGSGPITKCFCDETTKTVSCARLKLQEVPRGIPTDTIHLNLANNNITILPDDAFQNLTNLKELRISSCRIERIGEKTFASLRNLMRLDLRSNLALTIEILEKSLFNVLHYTSISELKLSSMNFTFRNTSLKPLHNVSLVILDVSNSKKICDLANGTFSGLNISTLSLLNCQCSKLNQQAFSNFTLQKLMLQKNKLVDFPSFRRLGPRSQIKQSLTSIDLTGNLISLITKSMLKGFPVLERIILSQNSIDHISNHVFEDLPALKNLQLQNNRIRTVKGLTFKTQCLEVLHLEGNPISISGEMVDMFQNLTHIKEIYLGPATFPDSSAEDRLFQNLTTLRKLFLNDIHRIYYVSSHFLKGLYNLTHLNLNLNNIRGFQRGAMDDLVSLKSLSLVGNEINVINSTFFPSRILKNLEKISLPSNPFECSCELFWFLDWIYSNRDKVVSFFNQPRDAYLCSGPLHLAGRKLKELHEQGILTPEKCLSQPFSPGLIVALSFGGLELIFVFIFSMIYRFRWSLKLQMFHLANWWRAKYYNPYNENQERADYAFDLFVSHNAKDSHWVENILIPELEVKCDPPYNLCVYNRNWIIGCDIADCIVESLSKSRKTLLLVTNDFAKSEWCQFELTMAQHRLIESDNDNVVLAIMEDIEPINMNPKLALMMKRKTYLEWTEESTGQRLFWEKLKTLLDAERTSLVHCVPPESVVNAVFKSDD